MNSIGKEIAVAWGDEKPDLVLTAPASGIYPVIMAAFHLRVPLVFAKEGPLLVRLLRDLGTGADPQAQRPAPPFLAAAPIRRGSRPGTSSRRV